MYVQTLVWPRGGGGRTVYVGGSRTGVEEISSGWGPGDPVHIVSEKPPQDHPNFYLGRTGKCGRELNDWYRLGYVVPYPTIRQDECTVQTTPLFKIAENLSLNASIKTCKQPGKRYPTPSH